MSNIKGILIFLVVFGHFIEVYKERFYDLYIFFYSFHMPLFIFISGYFAKRANMKKIINLVLTYLIFQTLYKGFFSIVFMSNQLEYTVPYFQLWYLLSMVFWYAIAIAMLKVKKINKYKFPILLAILMISLLSRYATEDIYTILNAIFPGFNNYSFSFQRNFSFMIFFFIGFFMNKEMMEKVRNVVRRKTLVTLISIFIFFILIQYANKHNLEMIFRGPFGVEVLTESTVPYFIDILICYGISLYFCFLLLNIVSSKKSIITKWGDNSLQIFLFHAFAVIPITYFPSILGGLNSLLLTLILFVLAIAVVTVLSHELFVKYTNWLCKPYFTIINKIKSSKKAA